MSKFFVLWPKGGKTLTSVVYGRHTPSDVLRCAVYFRTNTLRATDPEGRKRLVPSSVQSAGSVANLGGALSLGNFRETPVTVGLLETLLHEPWYLKEINTMVFLNHSTWFAELPHLLSEGCSLSMVALQVHSVDEDDKLDQIDPSLLSPDVLSQADYVWLLIRDTEGRLRPNYSTGLVLGNRMQRDVLGMNFEAFPRIAMWEGTGFAPYYCQVVNEEKSVVSSTQVTWSLASARNRDMPISANQWSTLSVNTGWVVEDSTDRMTILSTQGEALSVFNTRATVSLLPYHMSRSFVDSAFGLPMTPPPLYSKSVGALESGTHPNYLLSLALSQLSGVIFLLVPRGPKDPVLTGNIDLDAVTDGSMWIQTGSNLPDIGSTLVEEINYSLEAKGVTLELPHVLAEKSRLWQDREDLLCLASPEKLVGGTHIIDPQFHIPVKEWEERSNDLGFATSDAMLHYLEHAMVDPTKGFLGSSVNARLDTDGPFSNVLEMCREHFLPDAAVTSRNYPVDKRGQGGDLWRI